MRIINYSEARNQLKSVLDRDVEDADCTVITRRDGAFNCYPKPDHFLSKPAILKGDSRVLMATFSLAL